MKKKVLIFFAVALFMSISYGVYRFFSQVDGSTVESREKMIEGIPQGTEWHISQEQELKNFILSSIYSDTKSGIAVYKPTENGKYKLISIEWRNSDEIVKSGISVDGEWYDLTLFNGAKTDHAEIIYSVDGKEYKPLYFNVSNMEIICSKAPAKEYTLSVQYYDDNGNIYQ